MDVYKSWLIAYFSKNAPIPESVENENYFEKGLIDSFGVIELIEAIEDDFNIHFEQKHFQDKRFATIGGLAEIISELKRV